MSVAEAQQRISSKEFAGWIAYERIEPSEPKRSDIQTALLATIIANSVRDPKKKPTPFKVEDFLLDFELKEVKPMTVEELKAQMESIFSIKSKR